MGPGAGQQGREDRWDGWPYGRIHRRAGRGGVPRRAAGLAEGPQLLPAALAGAADPQTGHGQVPPPGDQHGPRPGGPGVLEAVLEPVFEADFLPCSYGFRPGRRVHDAVAEVRHLASHSYEWIVEGDIRACFDEISHCALLDRVRARIADRRVLALVKAFLKAGILTEDGMLKDTDTGTPQGSILSPLLSNVALSVLDEHIAQAPGGPASTPW